MTISFSVIPSAPFCVSELAAQARRRADRSPNPGEVLGPLDELIDYQYGPGAKASATKEKAKEAAKGQGGGNGDQLAPISFPASAYVSAIA